MSKRKIGIVLVVLGVVLVIVSLAADVLGIGMGPGIGWKQMIATAGGIIVMLVGFLIAGKRTG